MNHHCNLGMIYYQLPTKKYGPMVWQMQQIIPPQELSSVGFPRDDVPPSPLPPKVDIPLIPYMMSPYPWSGHVGTFMDVSAAGSSWTFSVCGQETTKEFDPSKCFFNNQPHWHCANEERTANEGGQIMPPVPLKLSTGLPCKSRSE